MNQLTVSLWGDESFTAVAVKENLWRMLEIVAKDTAPPLYYICLFIWTRLFGYSEIALRSLSVLFYIGTVFTIYLIAKHIWDKRTGLLALLIALANPFLFPFAFESRMYAILFFFVTLSFYFFITKKKIAYILASAAAIYSQHYAALALVWQFVWSFLSCKNIRKNWFKALKPYILIGLLYIPWLYPLYKQVTMVSTGFWLGKPNLKDALGLYINYLRGGTLLFKLQKFWPILALALLFLKKWQEKFKYNLLLLGWAIVPVALGWIVSQGSTSIFYDRYLIFIIPSLILLLAGGFRKISLPLIVIYCLPLLWVNWYYFSHPTKRPFKELAAYIKTATNPNDYLINYNGSAHHLWETKFYGLEAPLYTPGGELPYYVGTAQMTDKDTVDNLPQLPKIGVISSENPANIKIDNYHLKDYQKFGSLSFSWFYQNENK
jgi:hypothetical protein